MNTEELTYKVLCHWEDNVVASIDQNLFHYHSTGDDCYYCYEFADEGCLDCPVWKDTDSAHCDHTPYMDTGFTVPESNWLEFLYLLNVAYSQGLEKKYMEEL